ncbi:hypothetical protein GOV03_04490 [Candidatus Woesearchaeota archaeon]|nr:hypothetical protein [Candidatus Woesearchaeota archaeon]
MTTNYEMLLLGDLVHNVCEQGGMLNHVDLRPLAEELGLDLDEIMQEIIHICDTQNYNVGCHMHCTRVNVIPKYQKTGELVLNKDHTEGLLKILAVHKGIRKDY